jgi:hypothetical protein
MCPMLDTSEVGSKLSRPQKNIESKIGLNEKPVISSISRCPQSWGHLLTGEIIKRRFLLYSIMIFRDEYKLLYNIMMFRDEN